MRTPSSWPSGTLEIATIARASTGISVKRALFLPRRQVIHSPREDILCLLWVQHRLRLLLREIETLFGIAVEEVFPDPGAAHLRLDQLLVGLGLRAMNPAAVQFRQITGLVDLVT